MPYPKITIITPNFNQEKFLERTIQSVLNQNYPNLEYIIIDGGSTDKSLEIIKKYENQLAYWVNEKDNGLYDALNKGFAKSSGDIMGWLNSDDILFPNTLQSIAGVMETFPHVDWITGIPISIDEQDRIVNVMKVSGWTRNKLLSGSFRWIQQESTYWRRSAWIKSGARISTDYSLAADFELWMRLSEKSNLTTVKIGLAGFRLRMANQKSLEGKKTYLEQVRSIIAKSLAKETFSIRFKVYMIKVLRKLLSSFSVIGIRELMQKILNRLEGKGRIIRIERTTGKYY